MRKRLFVMLILVLAAAAASCRREAPPPGSSAPAAAGYRKTFGTGPVRFEVEVPSRSITTAEAIDCRLTLRIDEGFEAEFPDLQFPDDVPGLILTEYKEDDAREGTKRLRTRVYELEPEYDGTFTLPAMQVYFHKVGEVKEEMIESEPIELTVARTPADAEALALRDLRGLVMAEEIRRQRRRIWPWVVGGTVLAGALVAGGVYWARRPRKEPPPPPAHELALEALRQLVARDLIGAGRIEAFFVEITGIVREYIERAFGLRAPEQTTEEFLAGIGTSPVVARHRDALASFLAAADEVKFARATPDKATIQRAFDTARDFVLQTSGAKDGAA